MASPGTPGRKDGSKDPGFSDIVHPEASALRRRALPGVYPGAKLEMTESELLRSYKRMEGLTVEEREERALKLRLLSKLKGEHNGRLGRDEWGWACVRFQR